MSASSALQVLSALGKLRCKQHDNLVQQLLKGSLSCNLPQLHPSGLVAVAVRLAALQVQPQQRWLQTYFSTLQQQLAGLTGQQLAAAVVALTELGYREWPEGWQALLLGHMTTSFNSMTGSELLKAAQAIASCDVILDESGCESFLACTRPHLASMAPMQLVQLLAAAAAVQARPTEAWLRSFFAACPAAGLRSLPPAAWPQLLSALSALRVRPDGSWLREMFACCAPALQQMDPPQLAETAAAAASLGMTPPEPWVAALAACSIWKLSCCSPGQLAAIAEALVALKAHPGQVWLQQYAAAADAAMPWCSGEELARLVAAAAALKHVPAAGWLQRVEAASHNQLGDLSPGSLSSLATAMQQLAAQPSLSWVYACVSAAYPRLHQFDGGQLSGLFDALPALAPGPRWLDELCILEIWGEGSTFEEMQHAVEALPKAVKSPYLDSKESFRVVLDSWGFKWSSTEQRQLLDQLAAFLPFQGPVRLTGAEHSFWLCCVSRKQGNNGLPDELPTRWRAYIGPTSMDPEVAFLMTNMAQVKRHSLVLDPYVGTGSILVAAAARGAYTMGADIDIRVIKRGKVDPTTGRQLDIYSNYQQYGLPSPVFDAVLGDPPYGVRAGGRKSVAKDVTVTNRESYIPSTEPYTLTECLLVDNTEQFLTTRYSRRLVTMIKVKPYDAAAVAQFKADRAGFMMAIDKLHDIVFAQEEHKRALRAVCPDNAADGINVSGIPQEQQQQSQQPVVARATKPRFRSKMI
eukprot:gene6648-6873_t